MPTSALSNPHTPHCTISIGGTLAMSVFLGSVQIRGAFFYCIHKFHTKPVAFFHINIKNMDNFTDITYETGYCQRVNGDGTKSYNSI